MTDRPVILSRQPLPRSLTAARAASLTAGVEALLASIEAGDIGASTATKERLETVLASLQSVGRSGPVDIRVSVEGLRLLEVTQVLQVALKVLEQSGTQMSWDLSITAHSPVGVPIHDLVFLEERLLQLGFHPTIETT